MTGKPGPAVARWSGWLPQGQCLDWGDEWRLRYSLEHLQGRICPTAREEEVVQEGGWHGMAVGICHSMPPFPPSSVATTFSDVSFIGIHSPWLSITTFNREAPDTAVRGRHRGVFCCHGAGPTCRSCVRLLREYKGPCALARWRWCRTGGTQVGAGG